jgi:tetratricopeptide (TPR) repeat protein
MRASCFARPHRWSAVLWTVISCVLLVVPAHAEPRANSSSKATVASTEHEEKEQAAYPPCEGAPGEGDVAAAKGAFQAGRTSFEEGDYERAILYWEDAFRRDCTAVKLLLNVGRAYELNGDYARAVLALETYVARDTALEDRAAVERRIAKLKVRAEQQKPHTDTAAGAATETAAPRQADAEPRSASRHKRARAVWPVLTTAAGVVGLAVGATFTALGQKAISQERQRIEEEVIELDAYGDPVLDPETGGNIHCDRKGNKWDCPTAQMADEVEADLDASDKYARGNTQRAVGIAVAGGGAALTVVGAYFWYTLWKQAPDTAARLFRPTLLPVFAPGYQGLSLTGQF